MERAEASRADPLPAKLAALREALLALEALEPGFESRFWSQVRVVGECWEWQGPLSARPNGSRGYGKIQYRGVHGAHRLAFTLTYGPIPDGLVVMHRCDNPPCVRPDHLILGTVTDNNADRDAKGRTRTLGPKAQCKHGHPFDEENTHVDSRGLEVCRTCRKLQSVLDAERGKARRAKNAKEAR